MRLTLVTLMLLGLALAQPPPQQGGGLLNSFRNFFRPRRQNPPPQQGFQFQPNQQQQFQPQQNSIPQVIMINILIPLIKKYFNFFCPTEPGLPAAAAKQQLQTVSTSTAAAAATASKRRLPSAGARGAAVQQLQEVSRCRGCTILSHGTTKS